MDVTTGKPRVKATAPKGAAVSLRQYHNPKYVPPQNRAEITEQRKALAQLDYDNEYCYTVVSLKNLLEPAAGSVIFKAAVEELIERGVQVSISES